MAFYNVLMRAYRKVIMLSAFYFLFSLCLFSEITLPGMFTDNMILQQNSDVLIWGKADIKGKIRVITSWDKKNHTTRAAEDGSWSVNVKTPVASFTPYSVTISDGKSITLNNILIGEIWICSGQSNMQMPLAGWGKIQNYEQEVANAKYPNIRLLSVSKQTSNQPLNNIRLENEGWKECSPSTIPGFSSVAYFFGRNLFQSLNIPIGLINISWGGTIAEAWVSAESLELMPDFTSAVCEIKSHTDIEQEKLYNLECTEWENKVMLLDRGYKGKTPVWAETNLDDSSWKVMSLTAYWKKKELTNSDGIVWFRKSITIPKEWEGKNLRLSLGGIGDKDVTFFNGEKIDVTETSNIPRYYTIPAHLVKRGLAIITVKVFDGGGAGGFGGDANNMFIGLADRQKIALVGDWKYEVGAERKTLPSVPRSEANNPNRPTVLFNAMIHPLIPYSIRGVIWYQGEANTHRAYQYRELFPLLINDWRKQWNKNLPFYFVQLANFMDVNANPEESNWAELREAQAKTLNLDNTGMAVTIDIGEAKNIHPKNKQEVGLRLALVARAKTYGEKVAFSGPVFDSYKIESNQIRVSFRCVSDGLKTKDQQQLKGFAIAGLDHKFHWAQAEFEGNDVVVFSPEVLFPVAVRYAWSNNPVCNLCDGAGLPASPFRTDDWFGQAYERK